MDQDAALTGRAEADVLKQLRAATGLTQDKVCERVYEIFDFFWDRSELSKLETAKNPLSPLWRERLCSLYEVDVQDFEERVSQRLKLLLDRQRIEFGLSPANNEERPKSLPISGYLPSPLTRLIGREQEVADVVGWLVVDRLVTVTGSGGVGKTRIAIAAADAFWKEQTVGVWFVDLAPLSDATLVPHAVAKTLGLQEQPHRSMLDTLTDALAGRALLLVLDNCEHLGKSCTKVIHRLLTSCPLLRILATSRHILGLTGEQLYHTPAMGLPPARATEKEKEPTSLLEHSSVQLFMERAVQANRSFRLTRKNAEAIARICRRLDGIPLLIELAAARVRAASVEEIDESLKASFRLLSGRPRVALPHQQTLQATLDWSYNLLDEQEQLLMNRLSVFSGGWTLASAEQICSETNETSAVQNPKSKIQNESAVQNPKSKIQNEDVLDLLTSLVDKSLVICEERKGKTRYRLLETVRQYAAEKLGEKEESGAVRTRHQNYFLKFAEETAPKLLGVDLAEWLDRLEEEHDNLRAALNWSLSEEAGSAEEALRLCIALDKFWRSRGYFSEGRDWYELALKTREGQRRTKMRAMMLKGTGLLADSQGDNTTALNSLGESLAIFGEIGDRQGIASSLNILGIVADDQGDYALARSYYEQSLAIQREIGNPQGIAVALNNLGNVEHVLGHYSLAREYFELSLQINREIGDRQGIADAINNLGNVAHRQSDYALARSQYEESLTIFREIGNQRGIANALNNLGNVACDQGKYASARNNHEQSLAIFREIGDRHGIAMSLGNLGLVAHRQSDYIAARNYYEQSLAIQREIGDREGIASTLTNLGNVAHRQSDYALARSQYEESLTIFREIGDKDGITEALEAFAGLAVTESKSELAGVLWGKAEALRQEIGSSLPSHDREEFDRAVAKAREIMDHDAFEAGRKIGRAMMPEDAIELALARTPLP